MLLARHQRQNAQRAARALLDLQGRGEDDRAGRRQEIEVGQALQAVAAFAVHIEMRRETAARNAAPGRRRCRWSRCRSRARRAPPPAISPLRGRVPAYARRRLSNWRKRAPYASTSPSATRPNGPPGCGRARLPRPRRKESVSTKSASAADSFEQSITQAGAMKWRGWMVSTALSGRSLPDTQWIGASKCVPVCSPVEKLFQYQAGPRSS